DDVKRPIKKAIELGLLHLSESNALWHRGGGGAALELGGDIADVLAAHQKPVDHIAAVQIAENAALCDFIGHGPEKPELAGVARLRGLHGHVAALLDAGELVLEHLGVDKKSHLASMHCWAFSHH